MGQRSPRSAPVILTKSDADQYLVTGQWADALLSRLPQVAGFAYRCRHDEDLLACALFDDGPRSGRAHGALSALPGSTALDAPEGIELVKRVLRQHNAALS